jgi:hypothetical protein
MLSEQSKKYLEREYITLVGTFSRLKMVKPWFTALKKIDLPRDRIKLFIYNNTAEKDLHEAIITELSSIRDDYADVSYYQSGRRGGSTILGQDNNNFFTSKLKPIWEMWNDIKNKITTNIFMLIEDDTIAPPNAFNNLLNDLFSLPKAGFITGIETGRTAYPYQKVGLGVHYLVRDGNKLIQTKNLSPDCTGVQEIDCSGHYCFMTYTDLYKKAFKDMNEWVHTLTFFGMDLMLINHIQMLGYKLYADFDVWCDHLQMVGGKIYPFNKNNAIRLGSIWIPEFQNYAIGVQILN